MKKLFTLLFCALLSTAIAFADEPFRNHRYDAFKVLPTNSNSIVFIGNSITNMNEWWETFSSNPNIVNRGVSGAITDEALANIEAIAVGKPAKVFFMLGTNDLGTAGINNAEHVLKNMTLMVERLQNVSPDTEIYIQSILPSTSGLRTLENLQATNEVLKTLCQEKEITYIDLWNDLLSITTDQTHTLDGLHLKASGYQVWAKKIAGYVDSACSYPDNCTEVQSSNGLTGALGMRATVFSTLPVNEGDILIIGDEMIHGGEWHELLQSDKVKGRGTGWGYPGPGLDGTLSEIPLILNTRSGSCKPSKIFLYAGVADVNNSSNSLTTIETNYKNVVNKIKELAPEAKLYLMSLQPRATASTRITSFNTLIKAIADADENIEYVDIYTDFANNGIGKSEYFTGDYLYGMGYVKVAQKIAAAIDNNSIVALTDEQAATNYRQFELRTALGNAIVTAATLSEGDNLGEYSSESLASLKSYVSDAYALLKDGGTEEQFETLGTNITNAANSARESINKPKASTTENEYWYQITSLRSSNLYITAKGAATGVKGEGNTANSATSMWKFVDRGDNTYDIVNREYSSYLNPVATYNTQISTTTTRPDKGWTISYANTPAYYIISSGDVQLNQTGDAQSYAIYNWSSNSSLGSDRGDAGCQLSIMEAAEIVELPTTFEYTIDKTNGNLYHQNGSANQNWNCTWKSNATPQLQFGCGTVNNMNWADNNVQLMTGIAESANYAITAPAGYVITDYSFTFANNGHSTGLSLTMDDGVAYTTSTTAKTISATNKTLSSVSFTLAGTNSNGVKLTNFTVKIKEDKIEAPKISTDDNEYWYYITSASTQSYCAGKVIYLDNDINKIRFGDNTFTADRIWSFWEKDGKLAIKNYQGKYFGTAGAGTGNSTSFGAVDEANYIYNVNSAHDFFIIKDNAVELHAQSDNQVIVRWAAAAENASLWKFDEVDVSNAPAELASTIVVQGKVSTGIGNIDQPIVRSTIRVGGLNGSIKFQGVKGRFIGNDKDDVTNVKAYFATNSRELFIDAEKKMTWREENGEQFGEAVTINADGTFIITGEKDLTPGDNYLWITYDIAETAKEGNTVDVNITAYTIDNEEVVENNGNPNFSTTIFLSEGAVLMPMDKGSLYYRIPSITVTRDGKRLVTLTDDRKGHNTDLPAHCYLVAQYSEDNGRTWSDPVTVAGTAETGGDYGHGDASIVTNRDNGEIIGIMTSAGTYGHGFFAGTAAEPPRWKTITSRDGGLTWEAPVDHTDDLFGANCSNPYTQTWKSGFSGSGAALQKRDGTLVSSFVNRQADNSQHFYFFMSKDGGKSWYVSGTSGTSSADEPKTLERNNGDLAISVRATGYNYYNYTSNDGATWHNPAQTRFTSGISGNACDGEYMVWCSTVEGNPWDIAFQTLPNSSSRQNVSIALSTDEGATFLTPKTICPRGSAYSAAVVLPDGTLGVYYEENGVFGGYTMRFVRFSLDWASDGAYKFTESSPFYPIKSTNPTAIEEVKSENENVKAIYDLQGRKVENPGKGIYIVNGKKVLIK